MTMIIAKCANFHFLENQQRVCMIIRFMVNSLQFIRAVFVP